MVKGKTRGKKTAVKNNENAELAGEDANSTASASNLVAREETSINK